MNSATPFGTPTIKRIPQVDTADRLAADVVGDPRRATWRGFLALGLAVTVLAVLAVAGILLRPSTITWCGFVAAYALAGIYGSLLGSRLGFGIKRG